VILDPTKPLGAAELYLRTLTAFAPPHALLDVRYRTSGHDLGQLFLDADAHNAARTIIRVSRWTDVYVGVAPRVRRRGTREDIAPTPLLWADCDSPTALAALHSFQPPATMIVTSGTHEHAHAYWALTRSLNTQELEDANGRLAAALGADPKCTDAARVLRPPGTLNHKHQPPRPVELHQHTTMRYRPVEILAALPPRPRPSATIHTRCPAQLCRDGDPLLAIPPADYVRILTGRQPGRDGKILCPLHPEDTPSFHAYPTPQQGWACYGCPTPDGRPLGGDIYTLASHLWHIPTNGRAFRELRHWLDALFGVQRS
jgi:hypothetical protein